MAIPTQGTQLFFLDVEDDKTESIREIGCPTGFNAGEATVDKIETTCLNDTVRKYMTGLVSMGDGSISINVDPKNETHRRLFELQDKNIKDELFFIVGWADGNNEPYMNTSGKIVLSEDRSWMLFKATINSFPFAFDGNSVVKVEIPITRSGATGWKVKEESDILGEEFKKDNGYKFENEVGATK